MNQARLRGFRHRSPNPKRDTQREIQYYETYALPIIEALEGHFLGKTGHIAKMELNTCLTHSILAKWMWASIKQLLVRMLRFGLLAVQ